MFVVLLSSIFLLILYSEQEVANSVATNLSDENEVTIEMEGLDKVADDASDPIFEHCCSLGQLYIHSSATHFNIFVSRGLNQKARFSPPTDCGITLVWEAEPPSDDDIIKVAMQTGSPAHEFNFQPTSTSIFIPSNCALSQDLSQIRKTFMPTGPKFRWLVLSVPFKEETPSSVAEMDSFPTE